MSIDRIMRRTWRYWYEDGLTELAAGGILLAAGALLLAGALMGPAVDTLTAFGLPAIVVAGTLLARKVVRAAKDRLVYPRTGYVAYRRKSGRRRALGGVIGGAMGILVSLLFVSAPASLAWLPAIQGVIVGAFWLWLGYRLDFPRFYALAALSAVIGAGGAIGGLGDSLGSAVFFLGEGVAVAVSGGLGLLSYLRRTHDLAGAEADGC